MTVSDRWLLPDGVEDILPPQAARIEQLRRTLLDTWQRWGYQQIIPPLIEYLESLLTGTGTDLALQTFKLTDQLSGRLMGVRADTTPQAARIDAHSLRRQGVSRLCYCGHVVHTRPAHMLTGRTPLQAGCELFGSAAAEADQEIIILMLETLHAAGLEQIHLDLAHVAVVQGLLAGIDADAETQAAIFDAVRRKSIPELDELLGAAPAGSAGEQLRALARLSGGPEVLEEARRILEEADPSVQDALAELANTAEMISRVYPQLEMGFDFCELRGYNYHTGLVFAAFVPGEGQAVAQGGRYDSVGRDFGRARPATGFSVDLRLLVAVHGPSEDAASKAIWAPALADAGLREKIAELRQKEIVIQALPGDLETPADLGCDRVLVQRDGQWQVEVLNS